MFRSDFVLLTEVIRNIAQVAHACRKVAHPGIGIEVIHLSSFADVEKVPKVVAAAGELFDFIEVLVVGRATCVSFLHEVTLGAVENHSDFVMAFLFPVTLKQPI